MRIAVKVVPRSSRDTVLGWKGDVLRVAVTAVPERGRANAAVVALISEALGVARTQVTIAVGHSSSRKLVQIDGLDEADVLGRLGHP